MPLMRRRPLLRAAAVGGGAYMAGKHRANSQQAEADQDARLDSVEQQQAYAPPPPQQAYAPPPPAGGVTDDAIARLQQLGQLHDQGVLTDEEFAAQKAKVLG
jgi:Short C-terminal domain